MYTIVHSKYIQVTMYMYNAVYDVHCKYIIEVLRKMNSLNPQFKGVRIETNVAKIELIFNRNIQNLKSAYNRNVTMIKLLLNRNIQNLH